MESNIVYVSGALSDLPEDIRPGYLRLYEDIGERISRHGLTPYVPHLHTDPVKHKDVTPDQVDFIDRKAVTSSILLIAIADNPSLGVGIEVEMAHHAAKPVVLICRWDRIEQRRISRLIRGNPSVVKEIIYHDETDALRQLDMYIAAFISHQKSVLPSVLKVAPGKRRTCDNCGHDLEFFHCPQCGKDSFPTPEHHVD